jgi:hypothetical protein
MNTTIAAAFLRHALTVAAGILVQRGALDPAQTETLVGALLALASIAWSVWQKFNPSVPTPPVPPVLLVLLSLSLTGCDNPLRNDAGESTPAQDFIIISNYVEAAETPEITINAGGDVFVATDGGSIVYRPETTTTLPPTPEPIEEAP